LLTLVAVGAVGLLVVVVGVGLLVYCLLIPDVAPMVEEEPQTPVAHHNTPSPKKKPAPVVLEPVAFIKPGPRLWDAPIAHALDRQADDSSPGAAKEISAPQPPLPPALSVRDQKVNAAIDKGVAFLLAAADGPNPGTPGRNEAYANRTGAMALAGLTLLSCGVPADNPKVAALTKRVRAAAERLAQTYDVATCIWFLDKLNQPEDRELIHKLGLRLVASQNETGCWGYSSTILTAAEEEELEGLLKKEGYQAPPGKDTKPEPAPGGKGTLPKPKQVVVGKLPVFHYKPGQSISKTAIGSQDNSLTQFAVLALWVAQKHGLPAQRSLAFAETHYRHTQNANGTWNYAGGNMKSYCNDSMTCAGLMALAVGRGLDRGVTSAINKDLSTDPQVEKALLFLGKRIGLQEMGLTMDELAKLREEMAQLSKNTSPTPAMTKRKIELQEIIATNTNHDARGRTIHAASWGDYYFLWSLERAAVVYDLQTIGGKDWYDWGVEIIVNHQAEDGSWRDSFPGVVDTCFALLFLKRVNVAQDLTQAIRDLGGASDPGGSKTTVPTPTPAAPVVAAAPVVGDNKLTVPGASSQPGMVKPRMGAALPAAMPARPATRRRRLRRKPRASGGVSPPGSSRTLRQASGG
jgi:hypothetical protein